MSPLVSTTPGRGEVWMVNLNPTLGLEQAGLRPALVVSADPLNQSAADMAVVIPLTGTIRRLPTYVDVVPPEGGLTKPSVIMVEQVRAISQRRLVRRLGSVERATMAAVEDRLRLVLGL